MVCYNFSIFTERSNYKVHTLTSYIHSICDGASVKCVYTQLRVEYLGCLRAARSFHIAGSRLCGDLKKKSLNDWTLRIVFGLLQHMWINGRGRMSDTHTHIQLRWFYYHK